MDLRVTEPNTQDRSAFPVRVYYNIILQAWFDDDQSNDERIQIMTTFPLVCKWWNEAFTLLSRTHIYVPSPSFCEYYLRFLTNSPLPVNFRELASPPERNITMSPRTLAKTLTFRVEKAVLPPPMDWHTSPMGDVPSQFLHYIAFYKLLPNLTCISLQYIDITMYQLFFKHNFRKALGIPPLDIDMDVSFRFPWGLPDRVIEESMEERVVKEKVGSVKELKNKDRWDWPRFLAGVERLYVRCPTGGPTRIGETAPTDMEMEVVDVEAPPRLVEQYSNLSVGFKALIFDRMFEPHVKHDIPRKILT
ncbi:hypothetical protein CC1G_05571 [Coprinopsis cinerea okayama7|uniref:Uncharacterized protein n=1 Tax=Coprinopsis cinerea (strain Okayama-7 / 130 / ATCC MYA-4618 / FGSC 9003) TaxID=240176 RepID=A8P1G4_COPC7|nr:hypothetical protein CC1G_05571 [Coprinopsis cinerea okayama7\|eukprot:XP_001838090.1 hypothetical protein CC1G_05571 [Coprinopsis cinerea okayama7\